MKIKKDTELLNITLLLHQKISFGYFYYKTPGTHGEGADKQLRIECQFVILYYHVQKLRQNDLHAGVRIRREAEILDVLDSPKWGIYST